MTVGTAPWWKGPVRYFQHLLRETDAVGFDASRVINEARQASATAIVAMGGGFSAWYPTQLQSQRRNPHMSGDCLGEMLAAARAAGMRALVRMDISKGRAEWLERDPDWFVQKPDGSPSLVWTMPQICATGPYWDREVFSILDEILGRYPVDGFFFNYFGVPRCWCPRCRATVRAQTGEDVPAPGQRVPVYERWRQARIASYTARLAAHVHARQPDALVVPYHHVRDGWDYRAVAAAGDLIAPQVSNPVAVNPIDPQPQWTHWASEEALMALSVRPDRAPLMLQTGSAFFASRQTAMPAGRLVRNVIQAAAHGSSTCPAVNGYLDQDDPRAIPAILRVGRYLAANEHWYKDLTSLAKIALVKSPDSVAWGPDQGSLAGHAARPGHVAEFRGLFSAVSDLGFPCDVLVAGGLAGSRLARYRVVVLPAVNCLSDSDAEALDAYVRAGGTVVATADLGAGDQDGRARTAPVLSAFPWLPGPPSPAFGAYLVLDRDGLRKTMTDVPHVGVDGEFWRPAGQGDGIGRRDLRLLGPFANNAPEFTVLEGPGEAPGLIEVRYGAGTATWLPWRLGAMYQAYGLRDHAGILQAILEAAAGAAPVSGDLPPGVTAILKQHPEGEILHLLNDTAPQGRPQLDPPTLSGFSVSIRTGATHVRRLDASHDVPCRRDGDRLRFEVPSLAVFAAYALTGGEAAP